MVEGILEINDLVARTGLVSYPYEKEKGLAGLDANEVKAINQRIVEIAENEDVFAVLWSAREDIYDAVRAVKERNPESRFVGFGAGGDKEIDIVRIRPQDIVKAGTPLTTFLQSVTAGVADYESGSGGAALTTAESEARVYCGWADPIDEPKAIGVLINHEGARKTYRVDLTFDLSRDYPIIQHKPVIITPKSTYKIQVRYNASGSDMLMPIGVIVKIASNISL